MKLDRFVILFHGRDGSSQLVTLLNSHADAICFPEILAAGDKLEMMHAFVGRQDLSQLNHYAGDPYMFPTGYQEKFSGGPYQAWGFKSKLGDVGNTEEFARFLTDNDFSVIFLTRNTVAAAVSAMNSMRLHRQSGTWNARRAEEVMGSLHLDPFSFLGHLERRRSKEILLRNFISKLRLRTLTVAYEDLYNPERREISVVLEFLGLRDFTLSGGYHKNTPSDLREAISNYEEIASFITGTRFAREFEIAYLTSSCKTPFSRFH